MISFLFPFMFFLLPLPFIMQGILPYASDKKQDALKVPFFKEMSALSRNGAHFVFPSRFLIKLFSFLAWSLLICASANPQWTGSPIKQPSEGRNLMLALDISGSMQEADFVLGNQPVRRWDAVQAVANSFIQNRTGDRTGIVLFGEQAYLYVPLTYDIQTVSDLLKEADVGMAGAQTAIGDALGLALKTMIDEPAESKVIILLSDGAANAGIMKPLEAAELAKKMGVKIYTIGAGSDTVEMMGLFGALKIARGDEIDEKTLKEIALKTGGEYFRAKNTKDLVEIYSKIDALEVVENEDIFIRPIKSLFYFPLALAFLFSILGAMVLMFERKR